jgi:hypothetical protein
MSDRVRRPFRVHFARRADFAISRKWKWRVPCDGSHLRQDRTLIPPAKADVYMALSG